MSDLLFYVFAALAVASGLFMVSSRNAVNSAMAMIATLVAVAADYFLLDAPFLGVLQVLVYAGAVMVLFLFIIMLLDVDKGAKAPTPASKWIGGAVVFALLAAAVVTLLVKTGGLDFSAAPAKGISAAASVDDTIPAQPIAHATDAKSFGYGLFTKYMLPLQVAGFLLLAAMLGVVSLSKRQQADE